VKAEESKKETDNNLSATETDRQDTDCERYVEFTITFEGNFIDSNSLDSTRKSN